mmetsp:Transcript_18255/g.39225  ORF Transcript_18255/g.39225 Transcript_18255/m.39225 type:complete len:418 (-) Transcript_18255:118-1371(-)
MSTGGSSSVEGMGASNAPSIYAHDLGARLLCEWREGDRRECEVIERRLLPCGAHEYYVHYLAFNRRLDEWVTPERLMPAQTATSRRATARNGEKRRKMDPAIAEKLKHAAAAAPPVEEAAGELDAITQREHEAATRVKNIHKVVMGKWEMQAWYYSPFPEEYAACETLYVCEYDLHFVKKREALLRYMKRCDTAHPPGDEIYRSGNLSVFEIDGERCRTYCQNLCLLAKLFLDHKMIFYDVERFHFYVLTEYDETGCHPVGYFSKEKVSFENYNLACILTFPPYQRKGYGRLLIAFSYELSRAEGKVGTPERPLSDLGLVSYRSYWAYALLGILQRHKRAISISKLSELSSITTDDITSTLQAVQVIRYWKGQHMLCISPKIARECMAFSKGGEQVLLEPSKLQWMPHHLRKQPGLR